MKIKIPSKTFLWGEYSALIGGSAGVLTSGPDFQLSIECITKQEHFADSEILNSKNRISKDFDLSTFKYAKDLFHPDSPAGLLLKESRNVDELPLWFNFSDPYDHKGGFGRSTAEFISMYILIQILSKDTKANSLNWESDLSNGDSVLFFNNFQNKFLSEIINLNESFELEENLEHLSKKGWLKYRSFFESKKNKPSGYDLVAQMSNLEIEFTQHEKLQSFQSSEPDKIQKYTEEQRDDLQQHKPETFKSKLTILQVHDHNIEISNLAFHLSFGILLFKTKIKIKTHEHLEALTFSDLSVLKTLSQSVSIAFQNQSSDVFIQNLKIFDGRLKDLKYQHHDSIILCEKISILKDVIYARGCGALGADVIAVCYNSKNSKDIILKIETEFNLIFIADIPGID